MNKPKQPKKKSSPKTLDEIRIYGQPLTDGVPLPEGHIQEPHADYGILLDDLAQDLVEVDPKKK